MKPQIIDRLTPDLARNFGEWAALRRPAWHPQAVANALWPLRDQPLAFVDALLTFAVHDPECETPAAIGWRDRAWWQRAATATTPERAAADPWAKRAARLRRERAAELAHRATPDQIRAIREGAHA